MSLNTTTTTTTKSDNDLGNSEEVAQSGSAPESVISSSTTAAEEMLSKRRKELFGDCALIEIIHLHDCLRGALKALETDVNELASAVEKKKNSETCTSTTTDNDNAADGSSSSSALSTSLSLADMERRVAGRFKVIWSVFRAHSSAEDEFIWPALQSKTQGRILSCSNSSNSSCKQAKSSDVIEQEEYEEDHADEERMFKEMDTLLQKLRDVLVQEKLARLSSVAIVVGKNDDDNNNNNNVNIMAKDISDSTKRLSQHLMAHLEKEETQCMPLVKKHLNKGEIHELVGRIMGKRSADTIAQIMTMAVQNLDQVDREEMVKYMKQSMAGTFFDRWLLMSGWMSTSHDGLNNNNTAGAYNNDGDGKKRPAVATATTTTVPPSQGKRTKCCEGESTEDQEEEEEDDDHHHHADSSDIKTTSREIIAVAAEAASRLPPPQPRPCVSTTSQAELEKLIRAIASNPALSPAQKNTTIQGLRDSVWKSNQREKQRHLQEAEPATVVVNESVPVGPSFLSSSSNTISNTTVTAAAIATSSSSRTRRETPPSKYYKKTNDGQIQLAWNSYGPSSSSRVPDDGSVPTFSASELAPTYHDGAAGAVLGCPHYARACKLRHPKSGRLYTCRLCCEQQRELPMRDQDEPLDRYEVKEVMCMKCNTLQPAEDRCINSDECESRGKPFAKYFCRICHLYDDGSRPIFHCPYCNTCRLGLGLGIDFRHCMRCNACVSLADDQHHCIPQKLQGDCPICHDRLFQSTEPLRGLKCGHVMHLSCFTAYRRGYSYTCPLCMRSMEDMTDYFAMLDTAVRMQPMPAAYLSTLSNIYCQDCCKTGQVQYHFVGQKCNHCGSYNTREMGRVHNSPVSSTQHGQSNST